jgi:CheY-like chemotaxis protein
MEDIMKNVLIIDDEKSLLFSMKEGFEPYKDNLNILTANDGVEAIVALETNSVDLVVTDLKMPGLDGFQVIAHMSKNNPDVPIIVMTAFNTPEIEAKLKENGALTIFEKPVDFDEFVKSVLEKVNNTNNGKLSGISLASFMQLIQTEQKSCLVEVIAGKKQGHIFFNKGELLNSIYDGLKGEEAIYKLLEFNEVKIGLKKLPPKKNCKKN